MSPTAIEVSLVVAFTNKFGIGKNGTLPWPCIKADMERFKNITDGGIVIMGRKTYESLPARVRPLRNRLNIVITTSTKQDAYPNDVVVCSSYEAALEHVERDLCWPNKRVYVIGGSSLFSEAICHSLTQSVFATRIGVDPWDCDVIVPKLETVTSSWVPVSISETHSVENIPFDFVEYRRSPAATICHDHEEYQYLNLIEKIIAKGVAISDRTGVGTLSLFGESSTYDLSESFPLLTTKRVFWRGVVEELLWFIRGDTNANNLSNKGVKIWDGNGSRKFLDSRGLTHREEMDLGPVYGFQWRHFGATYTDMHADYTGQGVDQLQACIDAIRTNPADRRIILSAWNPKDLALMALPPCHMFCQFNVTPPTASSLAKLNCVMYQRSCDVGLGVPFNIASYSLLTIMMAHVCGIAPGKFTHFMGDTHVYSNHVEPLKEQLKRTPKPFPLLRIKRAVNCIDSFEAEDFELVGYNPHGKIAMDMAV